MNVLCVIRNLELILWTNHIMICHQQQIDQQKVSVVQFNLKETETTNTLSPINGLILL